MFQNSRERFLAFAVVLALLGFGGSYLYNNYDGEGLLLQNDLESLKDEITQLQQMKAYKLAIEDDYARMEQELTLEGNKTNQTLAISAQLGKIFNEVGLQNKYSSISPKDPEMEDDFKRAIISIEQIICTPKELGQLLYQIEKHSQVMEVQSLSITNLVGETGQISRINNAGITATPENGLLNVDLQVARLIDYATGEAPRKGRRS